MKSIGSMKNSHRPIHLVELIICQHFVCVCVAEEVQLEQANNGLNSVKFNER